MGSFIEFRDAYQDRVLEQYECLIHDAVQSLPHHARVCQDDHMDKDEQILEREGGCNNNKQVLVTSAVRVNYNSLTQEQADIYKETWCQVGSCIAEIDNHVLNIKVAGRDWRGHSFG